jgi:hypothetical protein
MYKSKSLEAERQVSLADRQHSIQVLKEIINNPKTSPDDRDLWKRCLYRIDPRAPEAQNVPESPMFVEFRKRWAYLN